MHSGVNWCLGKWGPAVNKSVVSIMSDIDREWFADHPGAQCYVRPLVPGELPVVSNSSHVLTVQVVKGFRVRIPFKAYRDDDGPLREIVLMTTGERWTVLPSGEAIPMKGTRRPAWEALATDETRLLIEAGKEIMNAGGQ